MSNKKSQVNEGLMSQFKHAPNPYIEKQSSPENKPRHENNSNTRNVSGNVSKGGNISEAPPESKPAYSIKLSKRQDEGTKRVSYYLKPSTIRKIQYLSEASNKGISETLQELLDEILDKVEVE